MHDLYQQLARIYSPDCDVIPDIYQSLVPNNQQGSRDCRIFALAYAMELSHGFDPSNFIFDQSKMRDHLQLPGKQQINPFPQDTCSQS